MTELPMIGQCALDADGLRSQAERYRSIGEHVASFEREPLAFVVALDEGVDASLVEQALDVERSCCPFFALDYDAEERRLRVGVRDDTHEPALEAIAFALGH